MNVLTIIKIRGKKDCASLHVLNKNKKEKKDLEVNQKK